MGEEHGDEGRSGGQPPRRDRKKSAPRTGLRRAPRPGSSIHWPLYVRTPSLAILGVWAVSLTLLLYFWDAITLVVLVLLAAAIVASALRPIVRLIPGRRWAIGPIIGILFVIVLFALPALVAWLMSAPIENIIHQLPQIQKAINQSLYNLSARLHLAEPMTISSLVKPVLSWIKSGSMGNVVAQAAGAIITGVIAIALLCFGTIYLLAQSSGRLTEPLERMLPKHRQGALRLSVEELDKKLRWWFLGTIVAMIVIAVACWLGFIAVGLKYALALALVAGVCEVIPTIGPTLAFILALLVAAAQGLGVFIGVAVVYLVIQAFESHILQPLVMQEAVRVPPVVVLFTLVLWARVIGPLGLLLAVPLDLVIWTFIDHFIIREGLVEYDQVEDDEDAESG